jgi:single-strand DNA-binding protein
LVYFASTYRARIRCGEEYKQLIKRENLMEHINRIELQGRVGTIRTNIVGSNKVANFSLVTDYLYKGRDGAAISETTWHNIVAWAGKDMPDLDSIVRGTALNVTGRLRTNRYTSADGTEKQFYEVLAYKVRMVSDQTADMQ